MATTVPVGEGIPPEFYRNAIDLNRFSNSVSKKLVTSYNNVILKAVEQLEKIERQPLSKQPAYKAARLRALIKQTKQSLNSWANGSVDNLTSELEGVARVQTEFVEGQLKKSIPKSMAQKITDQIGYSVKSVAVSPSFAKSVVSTDPTALNLAVLKSDLAGTKTPKGSFSLTAKQGQTITLPNGDVVKKAFRGLAQSQAKKFNQVVRTGLLSGDPTADLVRQMVGTLSFGEKAKTLKQIQLAGGELTKMANNQVMTIVRTTVNQVTNTASQTVYKANPDVTEEYRYIATLDSRTSPVCRDLDGQIFKYNQGPVPPQHFGCRSTTVAVVNYKKYGFTPPPAGKRASVGGPVPANTTYGKWLYGERAKGSKFKAGKEQIAALGEQKAKYFNRLSNKYGPDQALKKLIREDNTEVSLAQLQKRYGKPEDIKAKVIKKKAAAPKVTTPPAKPKTTDFEKRLVDSNPNDLRKNGQKLIEEVGIKEQIVEMKKLKVKMDKLYDSPDLTLSHTDRFKDWEKAQNNYIKSTEKLKNKFETIKKRMLETSLSDNQVNDFVDQVKFTGSIKKTDKAILKSHLNEYVRMFNGNGFVPNANGIPPIKKIGKAQRASCEFWEGKITTSKKWDNTWSKSTTFHEITHSVEVANPKLNDFANKWKFDKAFGKAGDKAIKDKTILKKYLDKSGSSPVYGVTEKMNKPVYKLKNITNIRYKDPEVAFVNDYLNPYMGKVYGDYKFPEYGLGNQVFNPSEVLTMSVETFADVDKMVKLYRVHPDLFELVVGMSRATSL